MASPEAVEVVGLTRHFGEVRALEEVDFSVAPGETFALLGPNGAGKSTAIRILVTLGLPTSGRASVFGHDVVRSPSTVRALIGYLPQQLSAEGALTGRENVWLFARLHGVPRREREARIEDVLRLMRLLPAADRSVSTYSGGMVRRLELAQALVHRPRLLILDEPTVGLDPLARGDFWERLREIRSAYGTTVLVTTHYLEEAEEHADRVAFLHLGRLRAIGTPAELTAALGPGSSLEDVFRRESSEEDDGSVGGLRAIRSIRRTANRVG
ncbi:MAG: ABC transporter ATP-binding protein [Thermoplasmata archaeon]